MTQISEESRRKMIAEAAYFRAEHRGFRDGDPVADWLAAENEIDAGIEPTAPPIGTLEARLATANERLAVFRKWLAESADDAHTEWKDDIARLARQRDRLRKRIAEIRERGEDAADKAKHHAEAAWDEIAAIIERLSHRGPRHD
jgi:chromosome segregation ATPase